MTAGTAGSGSGARRHRSAEVRAVGHGRWRGRFDMVWKLFKGNGRMLLGAACGLLLAAAAAGGQAAAGQRADIDELKAALDAGATMLLIDVREDWEVASGSMPGVDPHPGRRARAPHAGHPQGRAARLLLKRRRPEFPCCGALHRERIPGGGILRPERLEVERLRAGRDRETRTGPHRARVAVLFPEGSGAHAAAW